MVSPILPRNGKRTNLLAGRPEIRDAFYRVTGRSDLAGVHWILDHCEPVPKEWLEPDVETSNDTHENKAPKTLTPPELGEAAYYGVVGDFLRGVAPYTEATDAAVLAHFLPAVATVIGSGPYVYAGNEQPTRINSILVGPTNSGRKGTSLGPIDLLFKLVDGDFWRRQRTGGLSSGEGLIERLRDKEDAEGDVTPTEKRLFIVEEEFSRVLANIRRDGNILSQVIRQAFDSGNLSTMTVRPRMADRAHICIAGHITPEELEDRFDHIEMANGFGNRFLWWFVQSDKLLPRPEPIPEKVFQQVAPRLRAVMAARGRVFQISGKAEHFWEQIYKQLREDRPGLAGAATARGPAIVLRIALVYALLDLKKAIEVEHLEAAMAVWEYNVESAELLFQSETGDVLKDKILRLLDAGQNTKGKMNRHLSANQKQRFASVIERLKTEGFIKEVKRAKHKGAGRPAIGWERI